MRFIRSATAPSLPLSSSFLRPMQNAPSPARYFSGVDPFVKYAHHPALALVGDITLFAWANPESGGSYKGVLVKNLLSSAQPSPYEWRIASNGVSELLVGDGTSNQLMSTAFTVVPDKWASIGWAIRGSVANGWMNGVKSSDYAITQTRVDQGGPLWIGSRGDRGIDMLGHLAFLTIWNVALSDGEMRALASGTSPLEVRFGRIVFCAPDPLYDLGPLRLPASGATTGVTLPRVASPPARSFKGRRVYVPYLTTAGPPPTTDKAGGIVSGVTTGAAKTVLHAKSGGISSVGSLGMAKIVQVGKTGGIVSGARLGGTQGATNLFTKAGGVQSASSLGASRLVASTHTGGMIAVAFCGGARTLRHAKAAGLLSASTIGGSRVIFVIRTGGMRSAASLAGARLAFFRMGGFSSAGRIGGAIGIAQTIPSGQPNYLSSAQITEPRIVRTSIDYG